MRPSTLRAQYRLDLVDFAWNEWAQMGVLAQAQRHSYWAQDPEALIVFTLEVARDEPRLFDELLDWLLTNESLLSVRRLRNACHDTEDKRLVDAALNWVGQFRPRARLTNRVPDSPRYRREPLFRDLSGHFPNLDPTFGTVGFDRPTVSPSHKSRTPNLRAPINLAFRLRQMLGIGARSEVVRILLTTEAPSMSVQSVTRSSGFAKRNVQEALASLQAAGVVSLFSRPADQRYGIDRAAWGQLLEIDPEEQFPSHQDWPQLLRTASTILKWLNQPDLHDLSDYLLGSRAVDLLDEIRQDLAFAGISVGNPPAEHAWQEVEAISAIVLPRTLPGSRSRQTS